MHFDFKYIILIFLFTIKCVKSEANFNELENESKSTSNSKNLNSAVPSQHSKIGNVVHTKNQYGKQTVPEIVSLAFMQNRSHKKHGSNTHPLNYIYGSRRRRKPIHFLNFLRNNANRFPYVLYPEEKSIFGNLNSHECQKFLDHKIKKRKYIHEKNTRQSKFLRKLIALRRARDLSKSTTELNWDTESHSCVSFLESVNKELEIAYHKNSVFMWNYEANMTKENLEKSNEVGIEYSIFMRSLWDAVKDFILKHNCDNINSTITRQFKLLSSLGEVILPPKKYVQLQSTTRTMETIYSTATICGYKDRQECQLPLEPYITDRMALSHDPEELKYVWVAWRNATGRKMRSLYVNYVELQNEAARMNGFASAAEYWLSAYEDPKLKEIVDYLWKDIKPLYEQLHAYVRRKLNEHYGDTVCPKNGPIPAHILGNIWGQTWLNIYNLTAPYPEVKEHDITDVLRRKGYTARRMFQEAEDFFKSMNLSMMPRKFWEHSVFEQPPHTRMVCHASAWDMFDRRDFRIKMCTHVTLEDFIIVHHEMGHVQYYLQYRHQPVVFREGANPGFHEAIGDVVALSVQTPGHLRRIGLLSSALPQNPDQEDINFLFSMALQKIAFLPYAYVMDQWRWDVFHELVGPDMYNEHWWYLTRKLQGVVPPVERSDDDFDPGAKYHIAAGVEYLRYFISFVVQFQFHESLCSSARQYDGDRKPLHKCDIYKSTEAGNLLKRMLKMGLSEPWPSAMKVLTGVRSMDASPLLKYFKPLENWLRANNLKNDATIGWN